MDLLSYAMGKNSADSGGGGVSDFFTDEITGSTADARGLLKKVPPFTITRANISYLFSYANNLEVIEGISGTENSTHFNGMFQYCAKLTTLPVFSWASAQNLDSIVAGCNVLSDESLNNLMYMCIHCNPDYTGQKRLSALGVSSYLRSRCPNLSNYQAFLDAGWTLS